MIPDFQWLRRLTEAGAAREEPRDPATVEREVYEQLYGGRSSQVSLVETAPEPVRAAAPPARTRTAPKRPAPSRVPG